MGMAPPILLVEDDLSLAQTVAILLENLGVPVEHCATGEVAIELVRSKRYPVVVVDIILQSGISGLYVVSAIREMPSEERPLVLIITGASLETLRGVDRSVVTSVMLKPLDFNLFTQYVLATYRKALNLPHESGLVVPTESRRVRTFCGSCGAEITPWVVERPLLPRVTDDTFDVWMETPCRNCGSPPRAAGGRTEWRA
jgi:two-component system chemotaxis response regulator CheY